MLCTCTYFEEDQGPLKHLTSNIVDSAGMETHSVYYCLDSKGIVGPCHHLQQLFTFSWRCQLSCETGHLALTARPCLHLTTSGWSMFHLRPPCDQPRGSTFTVRSRSLPSRSELTLASARSREVRTSVRSRRISYRSEGKAWSIIGLQLRVLRAMSTLLAWISTGYKGKWQYRMGRPRRGRRQPCKMSLDPNSMNPSQHCIWPQPATSVETRAYRCDRRLQWLHFWDWKALEYNTILTIGLR